MNTSDYEYGRTPRPGEPPARRTSGGMPPPGTSPQRRPVQQPAQGGAASARRAPGTMPNQGQQGYPYRNDAPAAPRRAPGGPSAQGGGAPYASGDPRRPAYADQARHAAPPPQRGVNGGNNGPARMQPSYAAVPDHPQSRRPERPPYERESAPPRAPAYGGGSGGGQPPSGRGPAPGDDSPPPRRKKIKPKKQYRVMTALGITAALVGLCVFLAYFGLQSAADLLGLDLNVFGIRQEDQEVTITVPEGSSLNDIVQVLKKAGVVDTPFTFKLYAQLKDAGNDLKPGKYMLNCKMGYDQIIGALSAGEKERRDVVEIMFQEGLTLWDIARKLEENDVCTAEEFVSLVEKGDFENEFLKDVPKDKAKRFLRFEGYIYPDTYQFFVGEPPESVARKFINNFEARVDEDLRAKMKQRGLTLDETITLASIIQKEASRPQDMRMVSGVFHNRFASPELYPQMQSDVTIFYVNKSIKPYLERVDQAMYDAYNTYKCEGLPVGPICNPGMDAIEAALNPAANDYYYFVTDKNGDFYYAVTVDEHNQNIAAAEKVGGVGGIATED